MREALESQHQVGLPRIILDGGRRGWIAALIAGAVIGAVGVVLPSFLSDKDAFGLFAVVLGLVPGVYIGFALTDGRSSILNWESLGLVIYGALAVLALSLDEPLFLVAGYLGHGLWDLLHPHALDTRMPWWYVPMCIGLDFVFGIYILVRFV